jgi:hypothetical protein
MMNRFIRPEAKPYRVALAAALFAAALAAMAGCAKKVTSVDANFTLPEGTPSADARLILFPDVPIQVVNWKDNGATGPDNSDSLLDTTYIQVSSPNVVHAMIFDGTPASGYQVLRRESNGGLLPLKDFVIRPTRRFLQSQWELYTFDDPTPTGYHPPTYVGRGVVSDQITRLSPLTNTASLSASSVPALTYVGNREPTDTLISMKWTPLPEAAGYWIHVYQFTGGSEDKILSSRAAPFATGDTRDYFVGYVAAPADTYKIGKPGALVLTRKPLISNNEYIVRVSAVDAAGQMIGFTYGDEDFVQGQNSYRVYRVGGARVRPHHLGTPEPFLQARASKRRSP